MDIQYKVTMSQKQYDDYLQYLTTAPNIGKRCHTLGRHPLNIITEEIYDPRG